MTPMDESADRLRVRRAEPLCAETVLEEQRGLITSNSRHYVRCNFPWPDAWPGLRVDGAVARARDWTLADLDLLVTRELVVTMECAGNGRAFLDPPVPGEAWELGAVATAAWGGPSLAMVLDAAGVAASAVEVAFDAADGFVRSLPVEAARDPDIILATTMNGAPLPAAHGAPLRLVVPRWYGMASVKWLSGIRLLEQPFTGHFQTERYVIDGEPVSVVRVRSVITHPAAGDTVRGTRARVRGYAWSGSGGIEHVEVSDDAGSTWRPARLGAAAGPYGWTPWELDWSPPGPGDHTLLARARDEAGNLQPLEQFWNALGYCNNAAVPHRVRVV